MCLSSVCVPPGCRSASPRQLLTPPTVLSRMRWPRRFPRDSEQGMIFLGSACLPTRAGFCERPPVSSCESSGRTARRVPRCEWTTLTSCSAESSLLIFTVWQLGRVEVYAGADTNFGIFIEDSFPLARDRARVAPTSSSRPSMDIPRAFCWRTCCRATYF